MLTELLESLELQNCDKSFFEVIIIDDGSTDEIVSINIEDYSYQILGIRQQNQGGVVARNQGVEKATGEVLIFLDDDMILHPGYIQNLLRAFNQSHQIIVRGRMLPWVRKDDSLFTKITTSEITRSAQNDLRDFTSNNLAIYIDDFKQLGGWQEVIPGEPGLRGGIWEDLEFSYRAYCKNYKFITVTEAMITHRDYSDRSLYASCERAYKISRWAPAFLQACPEIFPFTPMFRDMTPISRQDKLKTRVRKFFRIVLSSSLLLNWLLNLVEVIENFFPISGLLKPLYRHVLGGYVYRGYRDGLKSIRDAS